MPSEPCDWYETPLYYDLIFDEDTEIEANFLEAMHDRHGPGGNVRTILEPACGSGRLVCEMAKRGWKASGFDASTAMLSFAREKLKAANSSATLWEDRMESFSLPGRKKFDLAHCLVSTFKYLPTEADAVACLKRISDALNPGGLFILGLHLTDYRNPRTTHERWVVERDGIEVVCNTRTWAADRQRRMEPLRNRLKITLPNREVREQETHWEFRTYSAAQLGSLFRRVPELEIVACHDFHYDPDFPRRLDDSYADLVTVLRRTHKG